MQPARGGSCNPLIIHIRSGEPPADPFEVPRVPNREYKRLPLLRAVTQINSMDSRRMRSRVETPERCAGTFRRVTHARRKTQLLIAPSVPIDYKWSKENKQMAESLKQFMHAFRNDERGQDLVEYALLATMMALGTAASMRGISNTVSQIFNRMIAAL